MIVSETTERFNFIAMKIDVITSNPEVMGGAVVFRGTRVPVETLFDHIEDGISIDEFLEGYPSVSRSQVEQVLDLAAEIFSSGRYKQLYEGLAG